MIQEFAWHAEFMRKLRRECPYSKGLRCVMAGIKNIQPQILCQRVSPMGALAGYEGIHACGGGEFQIIARPASNDANPPTNLFSARKQFGFRAGGAAEARGQFGAGNRGARLQADRLAVTLEERFQIAQAQCGAELGVVAEAGMRVEGKVRAIDRKVVFQQQLQQVVALTRPRVRRRPEQSVVHDQQIRPRRDGEPHRGEAGVHGGGNARDPAAVLHLQAVHRAGIIAEGGRAEDFVAVTDDRGERNFCHAAMKSDFFRRAKRESAPRLWKTFSSRRLISAPAFL